MQIKHEKVALITASSRGIGAGVARVLASRGYKVSLLARNADVEILAKELGGISTIGSVTNHDDLIRTIDATMKNWGRIDALVHNTGHPAKGDLLSLTETQWREG